MGSTLHGLSTGSSHRAAKRSRSAASLISRQGSMPVGLWSAERQRQFESSLTHLTVACNFPLNWVENFEALRFFENFVPEASLPSRKVLTNRLIPTELEHFRAEAKQHAAGSLATIQCDDWTGLNKHHLVAFMLTANQRVCTRKILNCILN